jgi:hypothetical protein
MRVARLTLIVAAVLLAAACGRSDPLPRRTGDAEAASAAPPLAAGIAPLAAGDPAPIPRRLHFAARSPEELAARILDAVAAQDIAALTDLRVGEAEHNGLLWPEFTAKDRNVPIDFAWQMLNTRSHTHAGRAIATWGGKTLSLVEIRFERGAEPYPTFTLHRGTVLTARTETGGLVELRFVGSLLELDGQWKALSYKD